MAVSVYFCATYVKQAAEEEQGWDSLGTLGVTFFLLVLITPFLIFCIGLCGFHLYVIVKGRSTKEVIKKISVSYRSIGFNIKNALCVKLSHRIFDLRQLTTVSTASHYSISISQKALGIVTEVKERHIENTIIN